MNAIIRFQPVFVALFFAFLVCTANGVSARGTDSQDPQVCDASEPPDLTDDMRWRLRAYNNLDCLIGRLDRAMNRPANNRNGQVTLSRQEVEQLRNLAWWAKDAAQRIGR